MGVVPKGTWRKRPLAFTLCQKLKEMRQKSAGWIMCGLLHISLLPLSLFSFGLCAYKIQPVRSYHISRGEQQPKRNTLYMLAHYFDCGTLSSLALSVQIVDSKSLVSSFCPFHQVLRSSFHLRELLPPKPVGLCHRRFQHTEHQCYWRNN